MALQHQQVLCDGEVVWALDMANGQHKCACGELLTLVHTGPLLLSARDGDTARERVIAGFDPDYRAEELEDRGAALSVHDFDDWQGFA